MSPRGRRAWFAALVLLAAMGAALALAAVERNALVRRLLLWQLARRGVADASLEVTHVGPGGLGVRELRIGDGDLTLGALELGFDGAGLLAGRLESARVVDLRVRGRIDERGLSLGALDPLRGGAGGTAAGRAPGAPLLPVGRLEIDRCEIQLDTPHGRFDAALSLVLDEEGRGRFVGTTGPLATYATPVGVAAAPFALSGDVAFGRDDFEALLEPAPFSLTLATDDGPQPIAGTTPRLSLRGGAGAPALEIRGEGGGIALLGPGLDVDGMDFDLRIAPDARLPSGALSVRRLHDRREPARFPALGLEMTFVPDGARLDLEGVVRGEPAGVQARFGGQHDLATGSGRVALRLDPLRFGKDGPALRALLPRLGGLVRARSGTVDARGELRWGSAGVAGDADLGLRGLTLETRAARIEGIHAALRLDGPWPPRTPGAQLVSIARLDFGLELTNGLLRAALRRDSTVDLEQVEWRFAGGVLRTAGRIDPFAPTQELELAVAGVDLAELLALVDLEGLAGTGTLEGRLPLSLAGGRLRIRDAELRAAEPGGWIRYRPRGRAADALGSAGVALEDFLLALHDFRYDALSLRVDGDAQAEVRVGISLAGANPEHRGGQRYAFNLNVDGRLGDLVREESAAVRVPDEIRRRLEALATPADRGR